MLLKDSNEIIGIFSSFITAIRGQLCILSPIVSHFLAIGQQVPWLLLLWF